MKKEKKVIQNLKIKKEKKKTDENVKRELQTNQACTSKNEIQAIRHPYRYTNKQNHQDLITHINIKRH